MFKIYRKTNIRQMNDLMTYLMIKCKLSKHLFFV